MVRGSPIDPLSIPQRPEDRVILALDLGSASAAERVIDEIGDSLSFVKVGPALFFREGPSFLRRLTDRGLRVFVDPKLHDVPNTVRLGVSALCEAAPISFLTVHACGGPVMIGEARKALEQSGLRPRPLLLAVTILTSLTGDDLEAVGFEHKPVAEHVGRLAGLAVSAGADGLVCSPRELEDLRRVIGPDALLVVPGIRFPGEEGRDDQKRVATPRLALQHGASYLVVGRPVLEADDRRKAFQRFLGEISSRS